MNLDVDDLKPQHFQKISDMVYRSAGINLKQGKEALVRARLMKRLRSLKIGRVEEYLDFLDSGQGGREIARLVDVMTTNQTSFFREMDHFSFLRDTVLPGLTQARLRFWSAACSSGEEPYTLAIMLREHLADVDRRDVRILATDISQRMLEKARRAQYPQAALEEVPAPQYRKYFTALRSGPPGSVQVAAEARELVRPAYLNLMEPWPMRGRFQVVFCRNVMIYFDRPTQQELIHRFWDVLEEGGYLFVGHSEGLSAIKHRFRYVRPAVYRK
ncbi:MAG: protein-glutamate O-methyltransferase CheR [Desulfobacterales bacterium]|jgi:chemotaxis protein methyltransferase CheR|nr:protein-glutamate O-methyltransferase CheR [Desulfobacterales bacterium]